jgi:hypothetical protein
MMLQRPNRWEAESSAMAANLRLRLQQFCPIFWGKQCLPYFILVLYASLNASSAP